MKKRYRVLIFLILGLSLYDSGVTWSATDLIPVTDGGRGFQNQYYALDLATEYYQRSGLGAYSRTLSMLWPETLKRRSELQKKLPQVNQSLIQKFRAELANALNQNSNDMDAYILAGRYQLYKGQYESALWNFQKALSVKPDSIDARIALADYFLTRWQPDQVIPLLTGNKSPESSFRLGEAYLQKNEYFSALGYLLQAEPLPGEFKATRNKDIAKAFLGIGEIALAKQFIQENLQTDVDNPVRMTLADELQGWIAWLEGNALRAKDYWAQGKAANPDYVLWASLIEWIHPTVLPPNQTPGYSLMSKGDSDLNSQLNIMHGFDLFRDKKSDAAYSFFLAGIKADHRTLIGFLGAARSQFFNKNYLSAANLCYQGLAVNPNFRPLLELKLDADVKLGKNDDVLKDRELLRKLSAVSGNSVKISGELDQTPNGRPILLLKGETKSLYGVWISTDGVEWQFQPWWGGSVYLKKAPSQLWVLPSGKDLSGEFLFVRKNYAPANPAVERPVLTTDHGFAIAFTSKVEAIAGFLGDGRLLGSYFSENGIQKHLIPYSIAGRDTREIAVWYRNTKGTIGAARFKTTAPAQERAFKYRLYPEKPVTNRRNIRLKLSWDSDSAIADKMVVSEGNNSAPEDWRNVASEIPFIVSEGDGVKEITLKLSDHDGNSVEIKTAVLLDTALPLLVDSRVEKQDSGYYRLQWTTNKQCSAWIQFLSSQGVWQKSAAITGGENSFSGIVPPQISYGEMILVDQAGNENKIPLASLNDQLRNEQSAKFLINNGTGIVITRNIEIRSVGEISSGWSVSNDLKTWTPIVKPSFLRWRLGPGEGEKLVFIKVYHGDDRQDYEIITIPIFLDTTPPIIKNLSINKLNDGYVINAEFSEPVCLNAMGNTSINDSAYLANRVWEIKNSEFSMNEGVKISVKDRAGNVVEFKPDFSTVMDSATK